MSTVESKIVTMKFDNKQFLTGVAATIAALGTLAKSLNFSGAKKGLDDLKADTGKFNLNNMEQAAGGVSKAFLAMSTIAITAIANLTTRAIDAGARIVKSLSLDQVISGFREYELNIQSIQTILANTKADGTNLEQVNAALDELNSYADKTIYNFAEMTRNIGTFTAAGVDLDTSVQSIKGIANVAAISGSNSQQASTAMYQLSQAIATGSVKLMDWNSVVNAGMGGEVFQKALFTTGQMMGKIADSPVGQSFEEWTAAGNTFRGSLESGWLTADVLTTTLSAFTGELDAAQLQALGYTAEQAVQLAELGQTGVEAATKVRTFTQLIDTAKEAMASGWSETFRTVIGDFNEATDLFTGISETFGGIIESSSEARNKLLSDWKELGGRTVLIEGIKNAFSALSSIVTTVKDAFRDVFPPMTAKNLYDLTVRFRDFTETLKPSPETLDRLKRIMTGLFSIFALGKSVIMGIVSVFANLFGAIFKGSGGLTEVVANIADFFTELNDGANKSGAITSFFERIGDVLKKPIENFDKVTEAAKKFFHAFSYFIAEAKQELGDVFGNIFSGIDGPQFLDMLNTGIFGMIGLAIRKFLSSGINVDLGGGILSSLSDTFGELSGVLQGMQQNLKANVLLKIAGAIGILALSLLVLSSIDGDKLATALTGVGAGMAILLGAMATLSAISGHTGFVKIPIIAASMILLSGAVLLLSFALKRMSDLSWEELGKGLAGVAGALAALSGAVALMSMNSKNMISTGIGLIAISVGLLIIAQAMEKMADMSWEEMGKGLVGIAASLGIIAGAVQLMPDMGKTAISLVIVGGALLVIAKAIETFAASDPKETGKGLLGIAAALAVIAAAMTLMPPTMMATATGLLVVAVALQLIARAVNNFGDMSWEEIGKGLLVLAASLAILAGALIVMSGTLAGAFALIIAAGAIALITPALIGMSKLSWEEIAKGLIALAGALTIIGIAAAVFGLGAPLLIVGGAALLVFGAGLALVGVAAIAFATAFSIAVAAAGAGATVITAALNAVIQAIPAAMVAFAQGIIGFVTVIANSGTELTAAFSTLIAAMLDAGILNLPKFAELFRLLIDEGIKTVEGRFPDLVDLGWKMINKILDGLAQNMPKIVPKGVDVIVNFLNGIQQNIGRITTAATNVIIAFVLGIAANNARLVAAGFLAVLSFVNSVTASVNTYAPQLRAAGARLAVAIIDGMTGGLASGAGRVISAAAGVATRALSAAMNALGIRSPSKEFMKVGRYSSEGLAIGLEKYGGSVANAAEGVAETALNTMRVSMRNMSDIISGDMDVRPVLTPVIDLTEVRKGTQGISKMFDTSTLRADVSYERASSISNERQQVIRDQLAAQENTPTKIEYNQYNTSPKPLSTIEIYRNTKSQLALAKEAPSDD